MIVVATDGSCPKNPGPGGWAWVREDGACASGSDFWTTNNRMELMAVQRALADHLDDMVVGTPVHIISDSEYTIKSLTEWPAKWRKRNWRTSRGKRIENVELIQATLHFVVDGLVTFEHVRGHTGHPLNEEADLLAGLVVPGRSDGN